MSANQPNSAAGHTRKFIIDGLAVFVATSIVIIVSPQCFWAVLNARTSAFPEWLVGVKCSFQDQIFFDLFNFTECGHISAHIVKHMMAMQSWYRPCRCEILFTARSVRHLKRSSAYLSCCSQTASRPDSAE